MYLAFDYNYSRLLHDITKKSSNGSHRGASKTKWNFNGLQLQNMKPGQNYNYFS